MLSCAKRPNEFMHLKPSSMQDFTLLLEKKLKKCIILSSHPLVPSSQSFDCLFPTEALNVVFKYDEIEMPLYS